MEVESTDQSEAEMSGDALDSRCRTLERLASEVSRLGYYAAKGKVRKCSLDFELAESTANLLEASK